MAVVLKPILYATLAMAFLAHYGILVATGIPYWRQSSWQISDPLYGRIPTFDGIWWQCMSLKEGGFTCNNYGKPTYFVQEMSVVIEKLKYLAFFLGGWCFVGLLVSTIHPEWKKRSEQSSEDHVSHIFVCEGLWWRCTSDTKGSFLCDDYGMSYIALDAGIQACRGLMVVACITSFVGLLGNILCLDCTTLLANGTNQKRILAIISGVNLLLAALCTLGATSYYAWQITYQFYSPYFQEREFKYEFGACLYTAWVAMALAIVAGGILTFGSCKRYKDSYDPYQYRPQSKMPTSTFDNRGERTEYV